MLPLVVGTFLVSSIAMLVALPLGLLSAIYLSEYAVPRVRRAVKPVLEVLAGVPTVVYGYFALLFVTPLWNEVKRGFFTLTGCSLMVLSFATWGAAAAGVVAGSDGGAWSVRASALRACRRRRSW